MKVTPNVTAIEIPGLQGDPDIEIYCPPGPDPVIRVIIGRGMLRMHKKKFLESWRESLKAMEPRSGLGIRDAEKNLIFFSGATIPALPRSPRKTRPGCSTSSVRSTTAPRRARRRKNVANKKIRERTTVTFDIPSKYKREDGDYTLYVTAMKMGQGSRTHVALGLNHTFVPTAKFVTALEMALGSERDGTVRVTPELWFEHSGVAERGIEVITTRVHHAERETYSRKHLKELVEGIRANCA